MHGAVTSSYLGTKIFSYLERRKQFKRDYFKVLLFLNFESEWIFTKHEHAGYFFKISHNQQNIHIWLANYVWGLDLRVGDNKYGGVTTFSTFFWWMIPWRRKLLRRGLEVACGGKAKDYYG